MTLHDESRINEENVISITRLLEEKSAVHSPRADVLEGITILLIEDTLDARRMFGRLLSRAGANVFSAASALQARVLLKEVSPDVIISDIGMPDEDGISFMESLRAVEAQTGAHTPAIALTAYAGAHFEELTRAAGFDSHLNKPASGMVLTSEILRLLH